MKKLMGISVIAALAVLPMAANAEVGDREVTALAAATGGSTENLATTSYVQGAYTAVKTQFDKMVTDTAVAENGNYIVAGKTVSYNLGELDTAVQANADAIAGLTGEGANSVENKIKTQAAGADYSNDSMSGISTISDAIANLDTRTDTLEGQMGNTALDNSDGLTATTVTTAINELQDEKQEKSDSTITAAQDAAHSLLTAGSDVAGNLVSIAGVVEKLDGDINTTGSVAKQIADAIAAESLSDTYATKTGTLATINASTVPIVTGWGQDATTTTTLAVTAPNTYQDGTSKEPEEEIIQ